MSELDPELEALAKRAGQRLRESEREVTPDISQRLAEARRNAVAVADVQSGKRSFTAVNRWLGLGAVAAGVLAVAVMLRAPIESMPDADDLDLVVAQEVELLEDLEFVAWMVAMEDSERMDHSG